jgi:uncharacterized protein YcbK (DUF882 family)
MPRIALLTVVLLGVWARPAQAAHHARKHARPCASAHHKSQRPDYARRPRHPRYLILHGESGSWKGYAVNRHGEVTSKGRAQVSRVLASWRTGKEIAINERLIRMLTRVSDHFGGRPIRVVSGYRPYSPAQYTPDSRHNHGKAVDFSIPGVPNAVLAAYCRTLHDTGCGFYPNSTFVHMDVRRVSAFWIDYAGPGQPPRYGPPGHDPALDRHVEEREAEHEHEASTGSEKTSSRRVKKSNDS